MRVFPKFNKLTNCPICGTSEDGKAVLVTVDGTQDGNICESMQVHLSCLHLRVVDTGFGKMIYHIFDPKEGD